MSCVIPIEFINNKLLHIDAKKWFDCLQDVGDDMTEDEKEASKKQKTGMKKCFFNGCFYKYIYKLASEFYINLQKHENRVAKLPKNKSDTLKHVSEYILLNCTKFAIADAHNHLEGAVLLDFLVSSKMIVKSNNIYIISHQDLLSHFYQFWVPNSRWQVETHGDAFIQSGL